MLSVLFWIVVVGVCMCVCVCVCVCVWVCVVVVVVVVVVVDGHYFYLIIIFHEFFFLTDYSTRLRFCLIQCEGCFHRQLQIKGLCVQTAGRAHWLWHDAVHPFGTQGMSFGTDSQSGTDAQPFQPCWHTIIRSRPDSHSLPPPMWRKRLLSLHL